VQALRRMQQGVRTGHLSCTLAASVCANKLAWYNCQIWPKRQGTRNMKKMDATTLSTEASAVQSLHQLR